MINVKEKASSPGKTVVCTRENGMKENSMGKVHLSRLMVQSAQEFGRTAATSSGLKILKTDLEHSGIKTLFV